MGKIPLIGAIPCLHQQLMSGDCEVSLHIVTSQRAQSQNQYRMSWYHSWAVVLAHWKGEPLRVRTTLYLQTPTRPFDILKFNFIASLPRASSGCWELVSHLQSSPDCCSHHLLLWCFLFFFLPGGCRRAMLHPLIKVGNLHIHMLRRMTSDVAVGWEGRQGVGHVCLSERTERKGERVVERKRERGGGAGSAPRQVSESNEQLLWVNSQRGLTQITLLFLPLPLLI